MQNKHICVINGNLLVESRRTAHKEKRKPTGNKTGYRSLALVY